MSNPTTGDDNSHMDTEIVDIVDENWKMLFQTSKQVAHQEGLLHRTIIAELIDSQGRWILVRQASDRQDAGRYVSAVGGHVRAGETELEALRRETAEEVGIKQFAHKRVGQAIFNRRVRCHTENHYYILYEIHSDDEPQIDSGSVSFQRFSREELNDLVSNPTIFGGGFHFVVKEFYPELHLSWMNNSTTFARIRYGFHTCFSNLLLDNNLPEGVFA
jgi:isopentenyl-diphosphate Delta-isomerase